MPDGPKRVPDYRAMRDDFLRDIPAMSDRLLVLDRSTEKFFEWAIEAELSKDFGHRPAPHIARQMRGLLTRENVDDMTAMFHEGSAFSFTLAVDEEPAFHFIQPFAFDRLLDSPEARGVGALGWHRQLDVPTGRRGLGSAVVCGWHELGHALFADQSFGVHCSDAITTNTGPGWRGSAALADIMIEQAEETFCDYYALGLIIRDARAAGAENHLASTGAKTTDVIRDLVHARIINTVAGMAVNQWGLRNMPRADWRQALHDFTGRRATLTHPTIAETAIRRVLAGQVSQRDFGAVSGAYWELKDSVKNPTAFFRQLGTLGRQTQQVEAYVIARDYLDVLDQRLPESSPYRHLVNRAKEAVAQQPKSARWDRQYPTIEASLANLNHRLENASTGPLAIARQRLGL